MKITTEKIESCEMALTIEAEPSELDESLNEAYQRLVQQVSVPGFRKGKAPRAILEQRLGRNAVLERALEHLIPRLYKKAIELETIEPIDEPRLEVVQTEPVIFKAIVPLKPEVQLGDYHSVKIDFKPIEVNEEDIQAALEHIRQEQAILIPVERLVQLGDLVTLDIEVTLEDKPFINHKGILYEVSEESNLFLPGVAQNLVGAERNKVSTFTIDVPGDYPVKEFAGKSYFFKITPTEIKEKELAEFSDELAQGAGYDSIDAMKQNVTAILKEKAEERGRLELREKALDTVVELSEVCYPAILEDREIEGFIGEEARRRGFKEIEDYLRTTNMTKENYREQLCPIAKKRIVRSLVLGRIIEQEQVEISAEEVDNKIESMLEGTEDKEKTRQIFSLPQIRMSIEQSLRSDKALDRLVQMLTDDVEDKTKED